MTDQNCIPEATLTGGRRRPEPARLHGRQRRHVDGRTRAAKRWEALCKAFIADLGRATPTDGERALCRRAATLTVLAERQDAETASGKRVDPDEAVRLTGQLQRVLEALEAARQARLEAERQTSAEAARRRLGMPDWGRK
jgi:hypothetical protein